MNYIIAKGLLIPFLGTAVGFCLGMVFLLILDKTVLHMHLDETEEGPKSNLQKTTMMILDVALD